MLTYRSISVTDWPRILDIQRESYSQSFVESLEALQSRWLASPTTCLVAEGPTNILGYALALPWKQGHAPALDTPLDGGLSPELLYIHDLAVAKSARGSGAASILVRALASCAAEAGMTRMALTSVQGSVPFWEHHGFAPTPLENSLAGYGADAVYMTATIPRH